MYGKFCKSQWRIYIDKCWPEFLHFHAVLGNLGQVIGCRLRSLVFGPPLGNLGSATDLIGDISML